jgi:hypothetical protein
LIVSQIETLRAGLDKLPVGDVNFARSLLEKADKGKATEKVLYWIGKLAESIPQTDDDEVPDFTAGIAVGNVSGIIALFDKAKKTLKYPKLRLQLDDKPVVITVAGSKSAHTGSLTVTDGRKYPTNIFYGRVAKDGCWTLGSGVTSDTAVSLLVLLQRLAKDPAKVAAEYGKLTGHCAFCLGELSDERSKAVGYGPVCAKKWDLPWGAK